MRRRSNADQTPVSNIPTAPGKANASAASDFPRFESYETRNPSPIHSNMNITATAVMVNRTHRVIRERAKEMQVRRMAMRSLWIPLGVSAGLLAAVLFAIWSLLVEGEAFTGEFAYSSLPDASQQILVLSMWCLPASAIILAVVWFRREVRTENGSTQ